MHLLSHMGSWVATSSPDIDAETTKTIENGLLDCLGCIYVGSQQRPARIARQCLVIDEGLGSINQGSAILGTGMHTARSQAAMLNAVAGHCLDFDDWELPGNSHPTVVVLPALLATLTKEHTGHQLLQAYVIAFEVIARLGEGMNFGHYDAGWHTTSTLATLGAAAGVSRLMGLSAEQATCALSLAISQAVGYTAQFGSHAKPMQAGFAARAGVTAAYLAASGATAQAHMLEHPKGMPNLMAGYNPQTLKQAIDHLGKPLAMSTYGLVLKPWTSCGYTHRIMTAALEIYSQGIDMDQLQSIHISLPDFHGAILPFMQPTSRAEALFSLPFVVAMGLLYGDLSIADLDDKAWQRPVVMNLIDKVSIEHFKPQDPGQNYDPRDPDRLKLVFKHGQQLGVSCAYPLGAPQNPMSQAQIRRKFLANCQLDSGPWIDDLHHWSATSCPVSLFMQLETLYVSGKKRP